MITPHQIRRPETPRLKFASDWAITKVHNMTMAGLLRGRVYTARTAGGGTVTVGPHRTATGGRGYAVFSYPACGGVAEVYTGDDAIFSALAKFRELVC